MEHDPTGSEAGSGEAAAFTRANPVIPVRVQPAQAHETATVLALIGALLTELADEGQEFSAIDRGKLESDLQRESASGRFLALLARDESGTPVGVLTISTSFAIYAGGEYGVIDEMYVRPEHRSQGIGKQLVDSAAAIAQERRWFRLDVTGPAGAGGGSGALDAADPALRFYRRLGFEPTGRKLRLLVPGPLD